MLFTVAAILLLACYLTGFYHAQAYWSRHHHAQMVKNNTAWSATWKQEREAHNRTIFRVMQLEREMARKVAA
jgi:hypothetical protein